jgi:hypothetical protein
VFNPGKRRDSANWGVRALAFSLTGLLIPWTLLAAGCGFWDDFRGRDYSIKAYFVKEDPLALLQSTDGNKRARALGMLAEPLQHGKTQREQDFCVQVLTDAATRDKQSWCRLQAIKTLGTYKDPRAVAALKEAYYKSEVFAPDQRLVLRIQAINSLGETASPDAVDLLASIVKAPKLEVGKSSEAEKQMDLDERIAAAAALSRFKNSAATDALVQVLRGEKDVALRDRAHESLQAATGKKLPAEAKAWEDLLYGENAPRVADENKERTHILPPILRVGGTDKK